MALYDEILNVLSNLNTGDLLAVHNKYCEDTNQWDSQIYGMNEFDDELQGYTPTDIALMIVNGSFSPYSEYFTFNGEGNLESFGSEDIEEYIYITDIANEVVARMSAFNNYEIQEILDMHEGEV